MNHIASVVLGNCTREFDKVYHYRIPGDMTEKVVPGIRVMVPFGNANKPREGYVLELVDSSDYPDLKEIRKVIDDAPVLGKDLLKLALWMRDRYICTCGDAIRCMLPAGIGVKCIRVVKGRGDRFLVSPRNKESAPLSPEEKILGTLYECGGECEYEELQRLSGVKSFSRHIGKLMEKGELEICEEYCRRVREKYIRVAYLTMPREEILDEIESNRIKKIQQIRVLEMLMDNEYISVQDILQFAGVSGSVLDTLKKYGYIDFKDVEVKRDPVKNREYERTEPLKLTPGQETVLSELKQKTAEARFYEYLLHGVTGSGKTEVYLQLIRHVLDSGKQAIVLVPEISLTPQMVERFKGRFGKEVAVLHSRLSLGERYDQWRLIKEGRIKVAVGARSAVFAPFNSLGLVVIDEEHESSYKSETTPKYHAAEIARKRCEECGAMLLLGSATPSMETYFRAEKGEIGLLELSERANRMEMPSLEIVDMRKELDSGNRSIFSTKLAGEIRKNICANQQAILFLNRRGHSSFVFCRSCGYVVKCLNCSISMTYHAFDDRLICHYCGFTTRSPSVCPKCKSSYIRHFGTGTQKVEEDLRKQFPEGSVIRMDMDTTTGKNSHEEILRNFREKNIHMLVGTQMIAKGHDFPNVTLVGVLAADSLLNVGDFNSSERTFQLLTQVAGRAGRGELPGRVVVQTYNTEDYSIKAACRNDYISFYRQEIKVREQLSYPPFTNLAVIVLSGTADKQVFAQAKKIRERLTQCFGVPCEASEVLGPTRSPIAKIKNKYRWRIIVKCKEMDKLISVLTTVSDEFYRNRSQINTVELSMDINPNNML